jgi:hypothetical protein
MLRDQPGQQLHGPRPGRSASGPRFNHDAGPAADQAARRGLRQIAELTRNDAEHVTDWNRPKTAGPPTRARGHPRLSCITYRSGDTRVIISIYRVGD